MYVCRSPFDLFLSAAPPSCTHLRICRQALPIIATLPSSETDGGKFCIDIHTEEEGVGAGCEDMTTPSDQTTTLQDFGLPRESRSFGEVELLLLMCGH